MKSIDVEGKTKDEALAKGLASLGLSRAQVRVDVLDEGGRGFLGLGGKPVRLRLQPVAAGDADPAEVVRTLLELMDVKFALAVETRGDETDIRIDAPEDDGLLIGRRGQTLDALRHLSQRIVAARKGRNAVVNIDVGDYRARREAGLAEKAVEAANQVIAEGRSLTLDPMSAQDRRIVHVALAEREDVSTYTVGRGSRRRVVISPGGARVDETAYDRVPDPGFRAQRLPFEDGDDEDEAMVAAEAQWRREEERERLRETGGAGQGGQRPPRGEPRASAPAEPGNEAGEPRERAPRRRGGRGRGEGRGREGRERGPRGRSEQGPAAPGLESAPREPHPREERGHDSDHGPTGQEPPARNAEHGREERSRGEHGRGGRDRGRERRPRDRDDRPRDRDDRRREDAGGWGRGGEAEEASGPAATRKEDLSPPRVVGDDSTEKAFPTELARRILKLGGEDGNQAARRKRRR